MGARSDYFRKRQIERRAWALDLLGSRCVECGSTADIQFHHVDPTTKVANISDKLSRWSIDRLLSELAKCVLLCRSCHTKEHEAAHGSERRFRDGCQCDPCMVNHKKRTREYMARYRKKKKATATSQTVKAPA